jgi:uncharacterized protein
MSENVRLDIIGLSTSQTQSGAYALILGETEGLRRLPIIIGSFEAQAIAFELERLKPNRPLTHDLIKSFADVFNIKLERVIITKFVEGVFYATLICTEGDNKHEIDSRTSDAVALALRFRCPIYCKEEVLQKAGIVIDDEEETDDENIHEIPDQSPEEDTGINKMSIGELRKMLNDAVVGEEYEKASKIRDEIKRREKDQQ